MTATVQVMDAARTATWRNLAATSGLRELPALGEILLAAKATIGERYAARVYMLAMGQAASRGMGSRKTAASSRAVRGLPALEWTTDEAGKQAGFRLGDQWLTLEPWLPPHGSILDLPGLALIVRAARNAYDEALPGPRTGERFFWRAYPPDEAAYEEFVRYLLRRASVASRGEPRVHAFTSGLMDGLDVRATIRHWHEDRLFVREERTGRMTFTNGVIDWTSRTERSRVLQGRTAGGWNDPDSAACRREARSSHAVAFMKDAG